MMDTQRLIAFIVFSFSALLLWDAWQKHSAPKLPASPPAASVAAGVPAATAPVPANGLPAPAATAPAAAAPVAAPAAVPGKPIHVRTDLVDVEINSAGGDIRRLTFLQVNSARDRTKPL